jgi:hypothetical protein
MTKRGQRQRQGKAKARARRCVWGNGTNINLVGVAGCRPMSDSFVRSIRSFGLLSNVSILFRERLRCEHSENIRSRRGGECCNAPCGFWGKLRGVDWFGDGCCLLCRCKGFASDWIGCRPRNDNRGGAFGEGSRVLVLGGKKWVCIGRGNSRSPSGMTTRKANARATARTAATATATADPLRG